VNLDLSDDERALADLAAQIFAGHADADRITGIEQSDDATDRELWGALATAGLIGVAVPEAHDGLGLGAVGLAVVCEQLGRVVAPVPLVSTGAAAMAICAAGSTAQQERWLPAIADGSLVVAIAAPQSVLDPRVDGDRLTATVVGLPWAPIADLIVVPVGDRLWALGRDAVDGHAERGLTTAREPALTITLDAASAEPIGGPGASLLLQHYWRTALAATQSGVAEGAVRMTADYTSQREQFGKPLSTFQGVALKAADAYLDSVAIRSTALQAAWTIDSGADPSLAVLSAAWWAAEAGQHCVHLTQHLHGGMGADITYPVHRYFLWGKQIELLLGGASALLAELGDALATAPEAGEAIQLD
jgi:3-oxocholest-4-en-26-oyl-CoA dehydrogenase beta subunit